MEAWGLKVKEDRPGMEEVEEVIMAREEEADHMVGQAEGLLRKALIAVCGVLHHNNSMKGVCLSVLWRRVLEQEW